MRNAGLSSGRAHKPATSPPGCHRPVAGLCCDPRARDERTAAELLPPSTPSLLLAPARDSSRQHDSAGSWCPDLVAVVVPGRRARASSPGSHPRHQPPPPRLPQFPTATKGHYCTASHNLRTYFVSPDNRQGAQPCTDYIGHAIHGYESSACNHAPLAPERPTRSRRRLPLQHLPGQMVEWGDSFGWKAPRCCPGTAEPSSEYDERTGLVSSLSPSHSRRCRPILVHPSLAPAPSLLFSRVGLGSHRPRPCVWRLRTT